MFYSGIADEAGASIEKQIEAHEELGWSYIELRNIDGTNLTTVTDGAFDHIYDAVNRAGLKVSCFASTLANWSKPITGNFQDDVDELTRAIPRMHKFNTRFIRIMSYPNDRENPLPDDDWRREVVKRIRKLARMAEDGGITLVHENCDGWGSQSPENTLEMLGEVDSPSLKLVFDTGNPCTHGQDAWEYYDSVRDHVEYVHIKDGYSDKKQYCMVGDGDCYVERIVRDLLARGYQGGMSIEPHIAAIVHTGEKKASDEELYACYLDYGRTFVSIVERIKEQSA